MNIGFYIDEMNLRGVANSTFMYAFYNETLLKNKSFIFYNKTNYRNLSFVIKKFTNKFITIGIKSFLEIDEYKDKYNLNYIYTQKGGEKDAWVSKKIKTLVHAVYPQRFSEIHGYKYFYISEWLSKKFSNKKIDFLPLITKINSSKSNLKKKYKINKNHLVLGCHGGTNSFNLQFVKDTIIDVVNHRKDIVFLFLNIDKFIKHKRILFLKGTTNEEVKKNFLNTCDAMIYGRSLGESFGLACAEFAILKKKIISYKFNLHKNHTYSLSKNCYIEYNSRNNLFNILINFKKNKLLKNKNLKNIYKDCTPKKVMNKFNKIITSRHNDNYQINFYDIMLNNLQHLLLHYNYIRHKIYQHFYKLIARKLFFNN